MAANSLRTILTTGLLVSLIVFSQPALHGAEPKPEKNLLPDAIHVVLEQSQNPKARDMDPAHFFDNSLIREVNRDYGAKLFPGEVK
jgi:hypothetical protein